MMFCYMLNNKNRILKNLQLFCVKQIYKKNLSVAVFLDDIADKLTWDLRNDKSDLTQINFVHCSNVNLDMISRLNFCMKYLYSCS